MKRIKPTPTVLAATLFLGVTTPLVLAHEPAPHAAPHGEHSQEHSHGSSPEFGSAAGAWAAIQTSAQRLESLVKGQQLEAIHDETDAATAALAALQGEVSGLSPDKRKRLDAAIRQAITLVDNLHEAADGAEQKKAESELKKVLASLKLVEAQLPQEMRAAGQQEADRGDREAHAHGSTD